jgi:hypothetical protein
MDGRKLLIFAPVVPVAARGTTTTDGAFGSSAAPDGPTAARTPMASTAPIPTNDSPFTTKDFMMTFLYIPIALHDNGITDSDISCGASLSLWDRLSAQQQTSCRKE